jgi:hypothetical protein
MSHSLKPGGIAFFESAMGKHAAVASLIRVSEQYYKIERERGDELLVYLSGMYVLGLFDYHDLVHQYTGLSSIVLAGPWQSFTSDAKEQAVTEKVGLFKIKGFMGSLNHEDHWNYAGPSTID